jgi:hypothetical protein
MLTPRQKAYNEILTLLLPHIRNIETSKGDAVRALREFHYEIELVHNIPPLLEHEDYSVRDEAWLKSQAQSYMSNVKAGPFLGFIVKNIEIIKTGTEKWRREAIKA